MCLLHLEMNSESKLSIKDFEGSNMLFDFPPSALDIYRKKASFDWKQMKLLFVGKDMIEFQVCFCLVFIIYLISLFFIIIENL